METNCAYSILFESTCNNNNTRCIIMRPKGSCTRGPSKRFNATNLHISSHVHDAVLLLCISRSFGTTEKNDPEIFVPVTKALQPSFEGPPMAPANMEPRVAESTGCQATPSRLTRLNERFARPYHLLIVGPSRLELFEEPPPCSEVLLDEIDYMKSSHLSYDCTMSHSCLLGFLCQNLFQRAIFCSLKQCSFRRSIQRVTLTTRLTNCSVDSNASICYQFS